MLDAKLYTFLKVVEMENYTKAGAELGLTQPAVSQHISKLEEHYGCRFFESVGRNVKLTGEGELFYYYARQQLANESELLRQLKENQVKLRMGSTLSIADYYLPELICGESDFDNVKLDLEVANTKNLLQMLMDGELECAFVEGIFDKNLFEYHEYLNERFIPIVAYNHPLAVKQRENGKPIKLSDLFEYPLILREEGSGTRAILENYFYNNNISPDNFANVWEIGSFLLIKNMMVNSKAVTFLYQSVAKKEIEEKRIYELKIENYNVMHSLYFIYLKNSLSKTKAEMWYKTIVKPGK